MTFRKASWNTSFDLPCLTSTLPLRLKEWFGLWVRITPGGCCWCPELILDPWHRHGLWCSLVSRSASLHSGGEHGRTDRQTQGAHCSQTENQLFETLVSSDTQDMVLLMSECPWGTGHGFQPGQWQKHHQKPGMQRGGVPKNSWCKPHLFRNTLMFVCSPQWHQILLQWFFFH